MIAYTQAEGYDCFRTAVGSVIEVDPKTLPRMAPNFTVWWNARSGIIGGSIADYKYHVKFRGWTSIEPDEYDHTVFYKSRKFHRAINKLGFSMRWTTKRHHEDYYVGILCDPISATGHAVVMKNNVVVHNPDMPSASPGTVAPPWHHHSSMVLTPLGGK